MTTLTKVADKLNAIKSNISSFSSELPSSYNEEAHKVLSQLREHFNHIETHLYPEVQKLEAKKNFTDPVSGAPRYGPKQIEKIDSISSDLASLRIQCLELIEVYQAHCTAYPPPVKQLTPVAPAVVMPEISFPDAQDTSTVAPVLQWDADAHRQAEESRRKRAAEMEAEAARRSQQLDYLKRDMKMYNERPRGLKEIPAILQQIHDSVPDRSAVKALLRAVSEMLGAIVQHPDKETLRRLRPDHPLLWERVTRHSGGLSLLLAVGFDLCLDTDAEPEPGVATAAERGAVPEMHSSTSEAGALLHTCRQLGAGRLVMVMEEPDVGRPDEWVLWFDALQGAKAFLDQELQAL